MMRKWCVIVVLCLGLSGCAAQDAFETLGRIEHESNEIPVMGNVQLALPESAANEVFSNDGNSYYECDGYTLTLQNFLSGNLEQTVRNLSGFASERLTIMESKIGNCKRYEWVWTATGEGEDVLCRAMILDDGNYHYCLTTMAAAQQAGALQSEWNQVFASFALS